MVYMSVYFSPDVNHGHPWFDPTPDIRADLTMCLGRLPEIIPHLLIGPVQRPLLLTGGPPCCAAPGGRQTGTPQRGATCYFLIIQIFILRI